MSKRASSAAVAHGPILDPFAGQDEAAPVAESAPAAAPAEGGASVTMYDATGAAHDVPAMQAPKLLLDGGAFFAKGQTVHVADQRGHVYALPSEQAGQAFASGMRVASEGEVQKAIERKDQNTIGKSLEAAAVGAGRGITLGLSDPLAIGAARAFGGDEAANATREHLSKLKEFHPIASTVGEVGGAVAPVLLSGGAGAAVEGAEAAEGGLSLGGAIRGLGALPRGAARLGEAAGGLAERFVGEGATSLAGRIAQRALPLGVQAGAEGAIYGAGATVSEAALGDEELTAEKLLAGAGHGAALGFLTGAGLGAGYEVSKAALDKGLKLVGKEGLQEWLQSVSDNQTFKALGANARDVKNLGGIGRSTEKAEERIGSIADTVRNYKFEDGEKLFHATSSTGQLADDLPRAVDEAGAKLGKLRFKVVELTQTQAELAPDAVGFFGKLDDQVIKPMVEAGGTLAKRAERVQEEFAAIRDRVASGEALGIEDLTKTRMNLDRMLYPKRVMGIQAPPPEHFAELLSARQLLEQTIEETTDRALQATGNTELQGSYQALKATFRDLSDAKAMAAASDMRALTRNTVGLGSKIALGSGAIAGGLPGAVMGGAVSGLANKYGNALTAAAAQKAATIVGIQRTASHIDEHMGSAINAFLSDQHEAAELAEHIGHVARETTKTAIEKRQEMTVPREAPTFGKREPSTPDARYAQVAEHLNAMRDPQVAAERIGDHVAHVAQSAPNLANALGNKIQMTATYLASKQPKPAIDPSLYPAYHPAIKPNDVERAEFLRRVDGTHPEKVFTHMKELRASPEEIETMKNVSPRVYGQAVERLAEGFSDKTASGRNVSYDHMVQASKFMGQPMHPTLEPSFTAMVQQMHAEKTGASSQSAQQGSPSAPRRKLTGASSFASQSSRIAGE